MVVFVPWAENHRTDTEYQDNLIAKVRGVCFPRYKYSTLILTLPSRTTTQVFAFQFINSVQCTGSCCLTVPAALPLHLTHAALFHLPHSVLFSLLHCLCQGRVC